MSVIAAPPAPTHELPGTRFTKLVAPSTGSTEVCVWRVDIDPGTQPTPHEVTREEVFFVLSGRAVLHLADKIFEANPGDAMVIPPHTRFALANAGEEPLTMMTYFPVGGQARLPEGDSFTPPWAL